LKYLHGNSNFNDSFAWDVGKRKYFDKVFRDYIEPENRKAKAYAIFPDKFTFKHLWKRLPES
jgi:hypothetical protein